MSNEEMKQALLDKLNTEQDAYRAWLLEQSPEEILNNTYEYTMRQDIICCMEELDLTDAQAAALLALTSPMQDIYREFNKRDASYMEDIRDSIETRAMATLATWQSPLYTHSGIYASEHGEMDAYCSSNKANLACEESIHSAIRDSCKDKYFKYLEELRDSGETNMYGAAPYLQEKFPELRYDPERARSVLMAWFKSFEKGSDTP